jgi:hypothetical protein
MRKAKPKKRGRKPGIKVGPYKKGKIKVTGPYTPQEILNKFMTAKVSENQMPFTPAPLTLCGQLEDAILLLENRISNAIAKINSLM